MARINLVSGYMAFGKTTYSKKLAEKTNAIVLTPDDFMRDILGRRISDKKFRYYLPKVEKLVWQLTDKIIKTGIDVIIDYNFWSKKDRAKGYKKAKSITEDVLFHKITCSLETSIKRVHERNKTKDSLFLSDAIYNKLLPQFEPLTKDEGYPFIEYNSE